MLAGGLPAAHDANDLCETIVGLVTGRTIDPDPDATGRTSDPDPEATGRTIDPDPEATGRTIDPPEALGWTIDPETLSAELLQLLATGAPRVSPGRVGFIRAGGDTALALGLEALARGDGALTLALDDIGGFAGEDAPALIVLHCKPGEPGGEVFLYDDAPKAGTADCTVGLTADCKDGEASGTGGEAFPVEATP